ncbi:g-box-binding factor 3-related [Anaeramoeba flamelloides]|uniref:G-box-binding factor 3-related n=1 Tax=Anaeramoeba flamelloides TaxID=1746091 RepID=A0AAV7ZWL4_9EUKA|nr:g-box-binding factor 3-related [Anaeramoeba flamelloides]
MEHSIFGFDEPNTLEISQNGVESNFLMCDNDQNSFEICNEDSLFTNSPIVELQFSVPYQRSSPISPVSETIEDSPIEQSLNESNVQTDFTTNQNQATDKNKNNNNNNNKNNKTRRLTRSSTRNTGSGTVTTTSTALNKKIKQNKHRVKKETNDGEIKRETAYNSIYESTKKIQKTQSGKIVKKKQNKETRMSRKKTQLSKEAIKHRQELLKIESVSQVRKMDKEEKRLRRLEKNRVSARRTRERKKAYWDNLETNNKELKQENEDLKNQISQKEQEISSVSKRFEILEKQMKQQQEQIQQLLQKQHQQQQFQFLLHQDSQQTQQLKNQEVKKEEETNNEDDSFQFESWLKDMISIPDKKLNSYFSQDQNNTSLLIDDVDDYDDESFNFDLDHNSDQFNNTRKRGFETFGISLFALFVLFGLFLNFGVWPFNKNSNQNINLNDLQKVDQLAYTQSKHLCSIGNELESRSQLNYNFNNMKKPTKNIKFIEEEEETKINNLIKKHLLEFKKNFENDIHQKNTGTNNNNPEFADILDQNLNHNLNNIENPNHNMNPNQKHNQKQLTNDGGGGDYYSFDFDDD